MKIHLLLGLILSLCIFADDLDVEEEDFYDVEGVTEDEAEVEEEEEPEEPSVPQPEYSPMTSAKGSMLFENFQSGMDSWTHSSDSDFNGKFKVGSPALNPAITSEEGIYVPEESRKYGIYRPLSSAFPFDDEPLVFQYELRLNEALQCGGAYIKLTSQQDGFKPSDVTDKTPYTVMFGPDKCGSTNKVHFIWRFKNPVTEEYVEHHLSSNVSPASTSDKKSHLYTLVIRPDNSFEVFVDKVSKSVGSLLDDFTPPVVPPKQIDDPTDEKPEDWVDETKIPDPEAEKPEDWDEDAPRQIPDPEAEKPEGWMDDESLKIPDPDAVEPDDWDEEDDGEWEAPIVDNPKCSVGCGEWTPAMIPNPDYKGKWYAPMIDNPEYIGEWKPTQIDNPAFFAEDNPFAKLDNIMGVTIDIWTMQKGTEFDNIYVGTSEDAAWELATNWEVRKSYQDASMGSSEKDSAGANGDLVDQAFQFVQENLVPVAITIAVIVFSLLYLCCCNSDTPEQVAAAEEQDAPALVERSENEDNDAPAEKKDE